MIGQKRILDYLDKHGDTLSHFIILVAPNGCGKRTIAKLIAEKQGATYAPCGVKVDEIREMINTANTVSEKVLYCIENADTMSLMAKNALLKVTEEPPKNAYIVMTVQNDSSLLGTIKSRGTVFNLEPYKPKEIREFIDTFKNDYNKEFSDWVSKVAITPGEVQLYFKYGQEFIDYVNLVIDNIAEVEPANAFKSSKKLAFKKEDEDNYDLNLFWVTFSSLLVHRIKENPLKFARGVEVTSPYINKSAKVGVNLQQLYDSWVFKIREAWL